MKNTVLVTGAGGFLGSHLTQHYLELGYRVIGVDNFSSGFKKNKAYLESLPQATNLTFVIADVCKTWDWFEKLSIDIKQDLRFVFHFASPASPPIYQQLSLETMWVNSWGLNLALETAQAYGAQVIFASTSEVYGDPGLTPQPESYWGNVNSFGARSCYDEAKRFGEALIYSFNQRHKSNHGLVRIFNTYGPRMNPKDGRVIINFLVQALKNEDLTVYGDGQQSRSFCYVDDLISGISQYAELGLAEPMNIGNPTEFTVLQLAEVVENIFKDKKLKITFHGLPADDPRQRRPDITFAKSKLPTWDPKVNLRQGLDQMIKWLQSEVSNDDI